jgi:bifunctional DNA-binding transcriptional regulator/antitoxin component of YhaV-PrlF toxin-antitoxin module
MSECRPLSETVLKVGRKGEIYTTRKVRDWLGIRANSWVKASRRGEAVLLQKARTLEELLQAPSKASVSVNEFERLSVRLQRAVLRQGLRKA